MGAKKWGKITRWAGVALGALSLSACEKTHGRGASGPDLAPTIVAKAARPKLTAFRSQAELSGFLKELAEAREADRERRMEEAKSSAAFGQPGAAPPPAQAPAAEPSAADEAGGESVTNTQHAGVDEGGIVKVHGDHLVVLRRGRLFTVRVGDDALRPVSMLDAFGPDVDPGGAWYDEMLISKNTIVVIGYSYQRGGTEVGLFDISRGGQLSYRATYHLRSNDYYSSRNYASRLIGDKLVFYAPLHLSLHGDDLMQSFPAMRRWHKGAQASEFRSIVAPTRVYRPLTGSDDLSLHTVTVCDLGKRDMDCKATAVMGPSGRVFYVSPSSVYVWMTEWKTENERSLPRGLVYRMPLDGGEPAALRTQGSPVDQFSFLEADGHLNVLVRAEAEGDGMWSAEVASGDVAMLRVSLADFTGDAGRARRSAYTSLPKPEGHTFQNRFVGDTLLYGTGSGWGSPEQRRSGTLYAYRFAARGAAAALPLRHGVDRIEALGRDAVIVGTDGQDLHFTPVALAGGPRAAAPYTRRGATQGELRSHGFFYKPKGEREGMLGLPIRSAGSPGHHHLVHDSASILFLHHQALKFRELGSLASHEAGSGDDGCRASCVDWYGNARPLFLQNRVFALLGYELVEGRLDEGRIRERRRVSFAPRQRQIAR